MGSPKVRVSIPAPRRCAVAERPEGPAPMTVMRQADLGARTFALAAAGFTGVRLAFMGSSSPFFVEGWLSLVAPGHCRRVSSKLDERSSFTKDAQVENLSMVLCGLEL